MIGSAYLKTWFREREHDANCNGAYDAKDLSLCLDSCGLTKAREAAYRLIEENDNREQEQLWSAEGGSW